MPSGSSRGAEIVGSARSRAAPDLARLERLARLLDDQFSVGGFRFGLDGLVGLVPGIGDTLTGFASAYLIFEAWRIGAPRGVLARMLLNVLVDYVVGSIPVLGDLFDFGWKANRRNLALLRKALSERS